MLASACTAVGTVHALQLVQGIVSCVLITFGGQFVAVEEWRPLDDGVLVAPMHS